MYGAGIIFMTLILHDVAPLFEAAMGDDPHSFAVY
jgi:hypothetical protein